MDRYLQLVQSVRACTRCDSAKHKEWSPAFDFSWDDGCGQTRHRLGNPRECEHPSTYAYLTWKGLHLNSRNPELLIVGQDPAGSLNCSVEHPSWLPGEHVVTNQNLRLLLQAADVDPSRVHLTNAVLCLKPGAMSASLPAECFRNCSEWLSRTIDVLNPLLVVALGGGAWNSIVSLYKYVPPVRYVHRALGGAVVQPPIRITSSTAIVARFHCSPLGTSSRSIAMQIEDWKRIGDWLRANRQDKSG